MTRLTVFFLAIIGMLHGQTYTRGVGVYPGDPAQDFAAAVVPDSGAYRNLALHRPAYQSSAYDYNLTAQLVTDGIRDTRLPRWVAVSTNQGVLSKEDREHVLDGNNITTVTLNGSSAWIEIDLEGGDGPLEIDSVELTGLRAVADARLRAGWQMVISGSDDGQTWTELGHSASADRPPAGTRVGDAGAPSKWPGFAVPFTAPAHSRRIRIELSAPSASRWTIGEVILRDKGAVVEAGGPYHFTSAWMSAGTGEEWVYVDLGAVCTFDRVKLDWIRRPAEGAVQVSDDAASWQTIQPLSGSGGLADDLKFGPQHGRYVRVLMSKTSAPGDAILSEFEVYGRGGVVPQPKPAPAAANGRLQLSAGKWRIQRNSLVNADGAALSRTGFDDHEWLPATVPGTVLSSYFDDGAIPDPNFSNNQLAISDSFFYADFWYRDEFTAPPLQSGQRPWLNFDGINWKAEVFLNGERQGRIDGGFLRGRFDVTGKIRPGQTNALAVRILRNATPGSVKEKTFARPDLNGGALGADNPTYHATIGWDWIPTIRGRDTGIWGDVALTTTGVVTIENPSVTTTMPLPDTSSAEVVVTATLHNSGASAVTGTLSGHFGGVAFETPVTLQAGASQAVKLNPLHLDHPKLWWPNGYGEPNLYAVDLSFTAAGQVSDTKRFQAGIRQFTYSEDVGALRIWINGRRFVARGGNWGFGESMLRYRAREYDTAVRYHQDMNFTMIRNWVGQIGDEAFYDACDKYGIVVWQDFWLANPADGPNPDDNAMFLANAEDFILRIRTHPSVGLYVGRNEGFPPEPLEGALKRLTASLHPGLYYIGSSADGPVSGHGPYRTEFPKGGYLLHSGCQF